MTAINKMLKGFKDNFASKLEEEMTISEYLELCKKDPLTYASAAERMLDAIGQPEIVDTATDPRLSRLFNNRKIPIYPAFKDFHGGEEVVEQIVKYFEHAAQGLEESKQILYLLGPVGGGKSSLAEKLKELMELRPFYVLKAGNEVCPYFENPLGLFDPSKKPKGSDLTYEEIFEKDLGINPRYMTGLLGAWTTKRLKEFGGDINKFKVVKLYPSKLRQIGIAKTEPGDENNQDISALVGKTDIRKLEEFSQDDPDSYSYSGGLCLANQGLLEFVEMFKAPIKVLHPLLTATQEGNYKGTEAIASTPFSGMVLAHSNQAEWTTFKENKNNEAFLDRIYIVKVPYCMRYDEEVKIYEKLIRHSSLHNAPVAPGTYEMMAQFAVLSRLMIPENSSIKSKLRVYNGESLKDTDPHAKSLSEYKQDSGLEEGMNGVSTRFAFKIISQVFNYDLEEKGANPVHLMYVLEKSIEKEQFPEAIHELYMEFINGLLKPQYIKYIADEIQKAYLSSYSEYGQTMFDRYVTYADHWCQDNEFRDTNTGEQLNLSMLNEELEKIEKAGGIGNPKDFRHDVVTYALRHRASHEGANPRWNAYSKIGKVIEKRMFSATEDILPIIAFGSKMNKDDEKKHKDFVERMMENGYTESMVRLLCEWWVRVRKS